MHGPRPTSARSQCARRQYDSMRPSTPAPTRLRVSGRNAPRPRVRARQNSEHHALGAGRWSPRCRSASPAPAAPAWRPSCSGAARDDGVPVCRARSSVPAAARCTATPCRRAAQLLSEASCSTCPRRAGGSLGCVPRRTQRTVIRKRFRWGRPPPWCSHRARRPGLGHKGARTVLRQDGDARARASKPRLCRCVAMRRDWSSTSTPAVVDMTDPPPRGCVR